MMWWEDFSIGSVNDMGTHTLGSPGIENVRWLKPVRAGDTIAYRVIVADARPSASKPGAGLVKHRWEARNQAASWC